ncbi:branched-chain amino acid transport system II carrier protein, partial [Vibrio parahaemolyticus]|uniref:branched-chain amino acid transport system II carrier protein n=1 Tax=Vibrio parahaemolyticus TaxID=670 RepID=UPI00146F54ED
VAIALMVMAPVRNKMSQIMVVATAFTALTFGCVDALHILGYMPSSTDEWMGNYMPLYNDFASWIVPSVFMMIVGLLFTTKTNQTEQFELVNE